MLGLSSVVVFTVLLPFAGASAGPAEPEGAPAEPVEAAPAAVQKGTGPAAGAAAEDPKARHPERAHAQCGPEVASPEGVEAQTCVLTEGRATWARTYYRNATGSELDAVLTLMGPGGRTVRVRCPVGAEDEPGTCETPHGPAGPTTVGEGSAQESWTAVAEFAGPGADGPLLLRSGSNSAVPDAG
ncbi:hypothetical protein [Streptomyces candidus]|uniref:Uncharacterized protein n=1 Tax=Streptomyces candidus TaxID=67283 RepID=A0A7X0HGV4_9ACTN|nr:hypothetical protein [Streptomyces candidus]MBB6437223.1 hypothetical protein [Streptomyces candidus]